MRSSPRALLRHVFFVASLLISNQILALSTKEDIQLIPQLPSQGNFDVTFHPGKTVTKGETVQVQFGVPLPIGVLTDSTKLSLQLNGVEIPIAAQEIVYWHPTDARTKSIRSVLITTDITFPEIAPKSGTLTYGIARTANYTKSIPTDPTASWVSISQDIFPTEFSSTANIREPRVYATFTPSWLEKSLLRSRAVPIGVNPDKAWFDEGMIEFGKTFVNDVPSTVLAKPEERVNAETDAAAWLFDRAQVLYGTYIRTGDVKWLRHAHRNAQFYKNNIETTGTFTGNFKLKTDDLKYIYGQSLIINLIFTGDPAISLQISRGANSAQSLTWLETYNWGESGDKFWTERHQNYALLIALSAWEITGESKYLDRAKSIVNASLNQVRSPIRGWAPYGCIQHTLASHEGDPNHEPICSSWMTALLADGVWKYYIHTKDTKALELLSEFGNYVENVTYVSTETHLTGLTMAPYIAGATYKLIGGWDDGEHGCDMGALAARAAFAKKILGQPYSASRKLAGDYLNTCKWSLNYWHRPGTAITYGKADWRLAPTRKYSWWFGTTLDYDWLLRSIDYVDTKPMPPSNFTAVPLGK